MNRYMSLAARGCLPNRGTFNMIYSSLKESNIGLKWIRILGCEKEVQSLRVPIRWIYYIYFMNKIK
jgi:hypothetical protein